MDYHNHRAGIKINVACGIAAILAGIVVLLCAQSQPLPGKHSWLLGLAGDWSVRVEPTEYEIGPAPDGNGRYMLFRWNGSIAETIKRNVRAYSGDAEYIIIDTTDGLFVIDVQMGRIVEYDPRNTLTPYFKVQALKQELAVPRPSKRRLLQLSGVLLTGIGLYSVIIAGIRRFKSSEQRTNSVRQN